jgi:hypothetical protein
MDSKKNSWLTLETLTLGSCHLKNKIHKTGVCVCLKIETCISLQPTNKNCMKIFLW